MSRRFFRSTAIILLLLSAFSFDHAFADSYVRRCLGAVWRGIGDVTKKGYQTSRESLQRFGAEVKRDGQLRYFMKDIPKAEIPSDTKLLGLLRSKEPPNGHWFWRMDDIVLQAIPNKITKKIYGAPYDLAPMRGIYRGIEKVILPPGKTWTRGWKMAGAVAMYPLTFYGLYERWLSGLEQDKQVKDLDYLIDNDYRFREVKAKFADIHQRHRLKKPEPEVVDDSQVYTSQPPEVHEKLYTDKFDTDAYREAFEIKAQYETYFAVMKSLEKQGLHYNDPVATMTLLSDPEVIKKIGPLFADVVDVVNPAFYEEKPFIDASQLKKKTPDLIHDLMKLNHLKIMTEANSSRLLRDDKDADPNMKKVFMKDPFYLTLKDKLQKKEITLAQAESVFDQRVEWVTRLHMFDVVGVKPHQIVKCHLTSKPLTISDIEKEIMDQLRPGYVAATPCSSID